MSIVSQRNEIVDCLEMDRLRELEEDESFEHHMGEYAAVKPPPEVDEATAKKKKKKREKKKKRKDKNYDADKDIDTSEQKDNEDEENTAGAASGVTPEKKKKEKDVAKKLRKKIISSFATSIKKN